MTGRHNRYSGTVVLHNSPHYERLMQQPPVLPGYDLSSEWAQRAAPPLLCHRVDECLLTYTAASHPHVCGVPPDWESYRIIRLSLFLKISLNSRRVRRELATLLLPGLATSSIHMKK
ncbi:hypothetical protein AVEN_260963-1 [Araneus ventricosus]|uniref:Uncharacterized protein n=1 Tax=Araneus ventricosus TaxID=182803 RepID=A0A4Y2G5U8_ARAVE|nr:hypothetical protein AVEN_260963-1 [Araneus ventricosus]